MTMLIQSPTLPATRPDNAPPAFHLLSKPTGAICNLDCAYCFYLDREADHVEAAQQGRGQHGPGALVDRRKPGLVRGRLYEDRS